MKILQRYFAVNIMQAVFFVLINFLVDVLYVVIDPRVKLK